MCSRLWVFLLNGQHLPLTTALSPNHEHLLSGWMLFPYQEHPATSQTHHSFVRYLHRRYLIDRRLQVFNHQFFR